MANSATSHTVDALIVGAGISGLVAAYELEKQGKKIAIIEQSSEVGGCVRTRNTDGFTIELGANTLALTDTVRQLLQELDLLREVCTPTTYPYTQYVWSTKLQSVQALPRTPLQLLKTPLFSFTEKLKIATGLFRSTNVKEDDSVAEVFSSLLGSGLVKKSARSRIERYFWWGCRHAPLIGGIQENIRAPARRWIPIFLYEENKGDTFDLSSSRRESKTPRCTRKKNTGRHSSWLSYRNNFETTRNPVEIHHQGLVTADIH